LRLDLSRSFNTSVHYFFFAWLGNFRRLVVRYERRAENYLGFVRLACVVILMRYL